MPSENIPVQQDPDLASVGPQHRTLAIFLISAIALLLELMLIRWIGTEIRIFAYLQNTVLIVCFFGLGFGCFTCRKPIVVRHTLAALLVLALLLAIPVTRDILAKITDLLSVLSDLLIWDYAKQEGPFATAGRVFMGLSLTLALMVLLWEIFLPLGRILGRLIDDHPHTIWAYSVNVAGSLVGIWLFVALSAFSMPPFMWLLLSTSLLICFLGTGREQLVNLGLIGALLLAGILVSHDRGALQTIWSPYQKLVLRGSNDERFAWTGKLITVNNAGYQAMIDLSEKGVNSNPRIAQDMRGLSQYDIPFRLKTRPHNVLVVGAGAGNDVAGALRGGASHVTAVEIDPAIIALGIRHHPERPYHAENVTIVNDDARSFFATTQEKFDLIIFGLLDSHTTTAMTNARLDHYVYTRESIARARELLKDRGVMVLSFEAAKPYIADRMATCLRDVFDQTPITFRIPSGATGWGGVMFVVGDQQTIDSRIAADQALSDKIAQWQATNPVQLTYATSIATDDWPYIYLDSAHIPTLYYLLAAMMLGLLVYARRRVGITGFAGIWPRQQWHFFFLGAAFLLLEVQNISKASVVLGNTWTVNAVIISGILTMVLLANLIAAKFANVPQSLFVCLLMASCVALYFVDLSRFAFLPFATKALLVGTLTTLPMLFAGIIFIDSFRHVLRKDLALGANLFGALVGGILQSVTFVIGIKALLLVVALLYLAAIVTRPARLHSKTAGQGERDAAVPESDLPPTEEPRGEPVAV